MTDANEEDAHQHLRLLARLDGRSLPLDGLTSSGDQVEIYRSGHTVLRGSDDGLDDLQG